MEYSKLRPSTLGGTFDASAEAIRDRLTSALRIVDQVAGGPGLRVPDHPVTENEVRAMLQSRRDRDQFFDGELFADPAWDILLELYAAKLGQQRVTTGDICHAAAVPTTTALRWVGILAEKGLIERKADLLDRRRCHLSLSSDALEAMASYFRTRPWGALRI